VTIREQFIEGAPKTYSQERGEAPSKSVKLRGTNLFKKEDPYGTSEGKKEVAACAKGPRGSREKGES